MKLITARLCLSSRKKYRKRRKHRARGTNRGMFSQPRDAPTRVNYGQSLEIFNNCLAIIYKSYGSANSKQDQVLRENGHTPKKNGPPLQGRFDPPPRRGSTQGPWVLLFPFSHYSDLFFATVRLSHKETT